MTTKPPIGEWFVYDPENGQIKDFDTKEDAELFASTLLACYRSRLEPDEWPDNIERLCWGQLTPIQSAKEQPPDADHFIDYQLEDL